ncbi:MAG: SRPBCC family protein [Hyphomicrobiales bacterium]
MKPQQVYVSYIQTSIDDLWAALTDPDETVKYFFGTKLVSGMEKGDAIAFDTADGDAAISGEILENTPKSKFAYTFKGNKTDDGTVEPYSRVTYELEETENAVKFTLIHDQFENENQTFNSVSGGWPIVLSGLKTYLETGKSIDI